jgi:hypothetical protein
MKIKKIHFSDHLLKLLIRIAFITAFILINWFVNKDRESSPTPSQETETLQTHHKTHKKKAPKPSSAEPTRKKRNKRNNNKRPVSASRRKKAEQEAAQRRADLECLLYEDSLN